MGRIATSRRALRSAAAAATAAIAFSTFSALPASADDQHRVNSGDTVSGLAARYGTSVASIVDANGLNSRALIVIGQTLTIPSGSTSSKVSTSSTGASGTHKVAAGETVWALARKYGTTVSAIVSANNLGSSAMIRVGQTLTISGATGATTASKATSKGASTAASSGSTLTHKVTSGDTVWALARKYGTSVSSIVSANNLGSSAMIRLGQKLTIPGGAAVGSSTATTVSNNVSGGAPTLATDANLDNFGGAQVTYTVKAGDTLGAIASKHRVTVAAIVSNNGLKSASLIKVGQKLTISGGTPSGLVGDSFAGRTYDAPTVGAANQNKATLNAMDVPSRDQMQAMVVAAAKKYGVDPSLAQAIAYQESGFNMRAVSPANAIGTMQVIPTSGAWASDMVGRELNLLVPADNVEAGVSILKHLTRNGRDLEIAIAGYYQGEAGVRKYGMYSDTKRYVASVLALMERF
ncbi:LysM peptidoglycan-binding domain-containing protein [Demequina globuliformis]|uniref:LysM peptidoglycan-binding domain-containing protein n=1 Tax=Demequina globuliformis TaxID=676202 RepID=UPI0007826A6B|nr:LysM peptidoglycan-binding domain-containing protein [Demequina globuliformis]